MKLESVTDEDVRAKLSKMKFGQFGEQLPTLYHYAEQVLDKRLTYNEVLEKNPGFGNPSNVEVVCEDLGLSNICGDSSIFTSLRHQCEFFQHIFCHFLFFVHFFQGFPFFSFISRFPEQSKAQALRKKQAAKMAYKHVAQGIQHFKSQKLIEAFQCLNQVFINSAKVILRIC